MRGRRRNREASRTFTCFGGACTVAVSGKGPDGDAQAAVYAARDRMLAWHDTFTRFRASELRTLNADPSDCVAVSPAMVAFVQAIIDAAELTGGLADATLLDEIEEAGYREDRLQGSLAISLQMVMAPERRPARPHPEARWRQLSVDADAGTVTRPPGLRLDGGGIVKGLAADLLHPALGQRPSFGVDCEGDMRFGGTDAVERTVSVVSPFDSATVLHELTVVDGAVAQTGITKRSWLAGRHPHHHLLDPATGQPAYTGVIEVTALAPTALEGEARAKAALLSGPDAAAGWLPHGGVVVFDDGSHRVVG